MPKAKWLVDALVFRLQAVAPEGFVIEAADSGVEIRERDATFGLMQGVETIAYQQGEFAENIETAAYSVLSGIQDFIAETLTTPWPGEGTMPLPFATVRDGVLNSGFGDERSPVILFESITIPQ
ncbi:MAG TPA: hypothetical protein VIL77_10830 [Gaiellaceae bacterium]